MTRDQQNDSNFERATSAVLRRPELYNLCYGCRSLVIHDRPICPACGGYRFMQGRVHPEKIVDHVRRIEEEAEDQGFQHQQN